MFAATVHAQAPPIARRTCSSACGRISPTTRSTLPAVIADREIQQRAGSGVRARTPRQLESDYGIVQLPGDLAWLGFREVLAVDGKPVPDSASRLAESVWRSRREAAVEQARRIAEESSRYNVGPIFRTINDPVVRPRVARRAQQPPPAFLENRRSDDRRHRAWVLRYSGNRPPDAYPDARTQPDLPARGRAWVDPETGRVLRGRGLAGRSLAPGVSSAPSMSPSSHDARLGFAVPSRMIETLHEQKPRDVSSGEATYSNYRKFTVDTRRISL